MESKNKEWIKLEAKRKIGLWENIRRKRDRGGKPLKPGQKGYPSEEAIKKSQE